MCQPGTVPGSRRSKSGTRRSPKWLDSIPSVRAALTAPFEELWGSYVNASAMLVSSRAVEIEAVSELTYGHRSIREVPNLRMELH